MIYQFIMSQINQTNLSKTISYALRHNPSEFGLQLDGQGWTDIDELIEGLILNVPEYADVELGLIEQILDSMEKKRWEIEGNRIRAMYGHSIPEKITYQSKTPPQLLYHGTSSENIELIKKEGLKPMSRQYVHLTTDPNLALLVAKRHTKQPVLLTIKALEAALETIEFYSPSETIWLSPRIPAQFLL
jgi:putative RNA 2'-phosphotransferase